MTEEMIEKISDIVHDQWVHWMKYFFTKCDKIKEGTEFTTFTIPTEDYKRWQQQILTKYKELSEGEKESDREWGYKYMSMFYGWKIEEWNVVSKLIDEGKYEEDGH